MLCPCSHSCTSYLLLCLSCWSFLCPPTLLCSFHFYLENSFLFLLLSSDIPSLKKFLHIHDNFYALFFLPGALWLFLYCLSLINYKLFNGEILKTGMSFIIILSSIPSTILPLGGNAPINEERDIVQLSNCGLNPFFQRISTGYWNSLFHSYH